MQALVLIACIDYSHHHAYFNCTIGKQSTIPIRLVSPYPEIDFMGRIEVFYDDQWGTICNDNFYTYNEGNVVCQMLNFTQGAACVPSSYNSFGQGTGKFH